MVTGQVLQFTPDTQQYGTAESLEKRIAGFKYDGPGWYSYKESTILIMPRVDPKSEAALQVWKKTWPKDQIFTAYCWFFSNVGQAFNVVVNAPVRIDEIFNEEDTLKLGKKMKVIPIEKSKD